MVGWINGGLLAQKKKKKKKRKREREREREREWQDVKSDVVRSLEKRKRERKLGFLGHLIEDQRANFIHFGSNFMW